MLKKDRYLFEKLQARLKLVSAQVFRERAALAPMELAYTTLSNLAQAEWQSLPFDTYWGEWVRDFLIRSRYQIPAHWNLEDKIALHLPLGEGGDFLHPEALIYVDGESFTAVDKFHQLLTLPAHLKNHESHDLIFDGWTGNGGTLEGDYQQKLYLKPCSLVLIDTVTYDFALHARTLLEVLQQLEKDSPAQVKLISILENAFNMLDTRHPLGDPFYQSVPDALTYIQDTVPEVAAPLDVMVHAAGHAHIDTAWLWVVPQTRRKVMRTFHTALHLIEQYPDYHFSQSQPQLYAFIEEDDPALFEHIKEAVKTERWEVMGGMWVEADCNITGAESYVRQFLYGRRYFKEHFGEDAESPILWLPDTFGYPASIPQMAKEAGIDYFFTTKLRWNEHNDFPYDTFYWEGLDGTRILSHITPTPANTWGIATYNAEGNAQSLVETWQRMKMKHLQQMALMSYGWGDGGGGPTPEMLDNLSMLKAYPAVPQVKQGKAIDFYRELEEHVDELPVWNGELYLETHQGTLTSQAWIKKANRKTEVALHDVELLSVQAMLLDDSFEYPQAELEHVWKILLLNQFHDILPGSSIKEVYDDAKAQFAEITEALNTMKNTALDTIAKFLGGDWIVINTVDFQRNNFVLLPEKLSESQRLQTSTGDLCEMQVVNEGTLVKLPVNTVYPFKIESLTVVPVENLGTSASVSVSEHHLDNGFIRAEFNDTGDLIRLSNTLHKRELLAEGTLGNQFQVFEDRPLYYDAWNIDPEFESKLWLADDATVEVVETGSIRATLKMTRKLMSSTITQYVSIYADNPYLEFRTHIDWQERNMLLKVAFPVNVKAKEAHYHIQWGAVKRPTHRSTKWDAAKYEVAAHHWADLGDDEWGITLVNDCKYAYDIHENVMRLTLLKGATYPDKTADLGEHEFTYRLYARHWDTAWQAGYDLNYPLIAHPSLGNVPPQRHKLLVSSDDKLLVETIKRSEDGNGLIVRALSIATHEQSQKMTFAIPLTAAWRVNFLEEKQYELDITDGIVVGFETHPYEIISIYLELAT